MDTSFFIKTTNIISTGSSKLNFVIKLCYIEKKWMQTEFIIVINIITFLALEYFTVYSKLGEYQTYLPCLDCCR